MRRTFATDPDVIRRRCAAVLAPMVVICKGCHGPEPLEWSSLFVLGREEEAK